MVKSPDAPANAPGLDPAIVDKFHTMSLGQKQGVLGQLTAEIANKFTGSRIGVEQQRASTEGIVAAAHANFLDARAGLMGREQQPWAPEPTDVPPGMKWVPTGPRTGTYIRDPDAPVIPAPPAKLTNVNGVYMYPGPKGQLVPLPAALQEQAKSANGALPDPHKDDRAALEKTISDLSGSIAGMQAQIQKNGGKDVPTTWGLFGSTKKAIAEKQSALAGAQTSLKALGDPLRSPNSDTQTVPASQVAPTGTAVPAGTGAPSPAAPTGAPGFSFGASANPKPIDPATATQFLKAAGGDPDAARAAAAGAGFSF